MIDPPPPGPYASLQIKDFRLFIFARLCITLAVQIQGTVVGWQVYELTKDPLSLGLIGLAEAVPAISVSLYAGHVADIVERRKIILLTILILLLCSVSLLFFTLDVGKFVFSYGALPIYAVIFLSGMARGFLSPANFSFMPQLVPRHLYTNAISLNSTFWEAASIAGPMLAGFIYWLLGMTASYTADVVLVVASLFFYYSIPRKPLPPISEEQGIIEKIGAGLKFVFNNQIVLSAVSLDLFAVLFGGAVALLPIFSGEILKAGPQGLGLLRAAPSVGAVLMAIYITHYPIRKYIGKILLFCVAGFGLCMIGFGLSTNFWLSMGLLVMSGMFDAVSVIVRSTLIHTLTPENMKGRVSAVNSIFVGSSNEIGAFESGFVAKWMGVVQSVVFGGCMTLAVVGITGWRAKKLRRLDRLI
ncbi:MAG TPA: MFS transporter [Cyclobacteriaceae bacterium]|nr:MFS transporter [Cyclobacteriaceae bacterium]